MNDFRVEVALPVPVFRSFTYSFDHHMAESLAVGRVVEVELGKRRMYGVVTAVHDHSEQEERTCKRVLSQLPISPLRNWQLQLALSLSRRYFATQGELLGLFIPPYRSHWEELSVWRVFPGTSQGPASPGNTGKNFYFWKKEHNLRKRNVDQMVERGEIVLVNAKADVCFPRVTENGAGDLRWHALPFREDRDAFCERLLRDCLASGKKLLVIFPDISALDRTIRLFREIFPRIRLIRYDGRATMRDRYLLFLKAEESDYDVICGTHIACFLPLDHVACHVIFDPDERGHVSDRFPRYESLSVLREKIGLTGGILDVVGVSPDLNLFFGLQEGLFNEQKTETSVSLRSERTIRSVVMDRKRSLLSMTARLAIGQTLKQGGCAIVWIQKSGYSAALGCRDCGYYYTCPKCDTAYRYFREKNSLLCPLCGLRDEPKASCPRCSGVWFDCWGFAVESAFDEIRKGFPGADMQLVEGEWSEERNPLVRPGILVGTTAVLKESVLRFSELVILASLDEWMRIPDFRTRERLFHLLKKIVTYLGIDVASPPCVMVQTSSLFEKQISSLFKPTASFYRDELSKRQRIGYPPYQGLLRIVARGGNTDRRTRVCSDLVHQFNQAGFVAYGPYPTAGLRKQGALSDEVIVHFSWDRQDVLYGLVEKVFPARWKNGVRVEFDIV